MSNHSTHHETYLQEQMSNPEFRALYALARHKVHLEFLLETTRLHVEENSRQETLLADISEIEQYLDRIELES